jgi:hypothetical protein
VLDEAGCRDKLSPPLALFTDTTRTEPPTSQGMQSERGDFSVFDGPLLIAPAHRLAVLDSQPLLQFLTHLVPCYAHAAAWSA